jgi:hypothetical protein
MLQVWNQTCANPVVTCFGETLQTNLIEANKKKTLAICHYYAAG